MEKEIEKQIEKQILNALKSLSEKFGCNFTLGEDGIKITNIPKEIDKFEKIGY